MKKLKLILFILALAIFGLLANGRPASPAALPASSGGSESVSLQSADPSGADAAARTQDALSAEAASSSPLPLGDYGGRLQISELMVSNKASVPCEDGRFYDWVELENICGESLSLEGWALSDREGLARWRFPAGELEPGERLLVFFDGRQGPGFSLSKGETLYLLSPDTAVRDQVFCSSDRDDQSLIRQADGSFVLTPWISPGLENGAAGYEAWCLGRTVGTGLVINEAAVYNTRYVAGGNSEPCDWVEIKNASGETLSLAGCSLSDKAGKALWQFPDRELAPGELLVICCHDDEEDGSIGTALNTGFSLGADEDQLFLRDGSGALLDYAALHSIPLDGSMGRLDGQPGFFYFASPSPGEDNSGGCRRVTDCPIPASPDGVYDDVESVSVELCSPGEIHYTLDGTVPTLDSPVYTEPLVLRATGIVRAIAREENALTSPVATYSYIINEHHTLPVLSIAVDDADRFYTMYRNGYRVWRVPGNLALYDGEHSFNRACDVTLRGWTSLELPKKSFGVFFKGRHGGNLDVDVFGNGISEYSNLAIRGGQDYTFSIFRNELMEDLCLEASDACLTQASKFCILYVEGKYYGIYALKEDFSKQYYASHAGVSVKSVESEKFPVAMESEFQRKIVDPSWHGDFTQDALYHEVTDRMDLDSLIDWFLLESYCANTDIQGNLRLYRSTENGNKWAFCFYDLDWGFYYPNSCFGAIIADRGNAGAQIPPLIRALIRNGSFREKTLQRFAELLNGPLSTEHVLEKIDEYQALLEPEVARDRERWKLTVDQWNTRVDELRQFIRDDWDLHNINQICSFLHVGELERKQLFGR